MIPSLCVTAGVGYLGRVPTSQGLYRRGMGMVTGVACWVLSVILGKTTDIKDLIILLTAGLLAEALRLPWDKWPLERWLDSVEHEDAIDPTRKMIDPHHHLWDPLNQPKGWPIPGFVFTLMKILRPHFIFAADETMRATFGNRHPLCHTYMGKELYEDIHNNGKGHNIVGTVYMECGWKETSRTPPAMIPTGEADMAFAANTVSPILCKAVVCHADLMLGAEVEPALKYYKERGVCGIRYSLAHHPEGKVMGAGPKKDVRSEQFLKGFALLEKYDLSYDCWLFHTNLSDLIFLAQKFPNTTIICDHVALPIQDETQNTRATWKLQMQTLSSYPNVRVKLSGMGMAVTGLGFDRLPKPATSAVLAEAWAPYYLHVICCFGSNRCMFASNFPVDKVAGGYTTHFNAHKLIVRDLPEEDKHNLFYQTAVDTYKIKM